MKGTGPGAAHHGPDDGDAPPSSATRTLRQQGYVELLKGIWQGVVIADVPPAGRDAPGASSQAPSFGNNQLHFVS